MTQTKHPSFLLFLCHLNSEQAKDSSKTMDFLFIKLSSTSSTILLLSLIVFVLFCNTKAAIQLPPNVIVPAVIAFGDSIVDTGNNNHLKSVIKCNFAPYGKDLKGPLGRFCNGKVPVDLIGTSLSLSLNFSGLGLFYIFFWFVFYLYLLCYLTQKKTSKELLVACCSFRGLVCHSRQIYPSEETFCIYSCASELLL